MQQATAGRENSAAISPMPLPSWRTKCGPSLRKLLAVYTRAHDPDCPVVFLDETSKQLVAETRVPGPIKPAQPARSDYEYERKALSHCQIVHATNLLARWAHAAVTTSRHACMV